MMIILKILDKEKTLKIFDKILNNEKNLSQDLIEEEKILNLKIIGKHYWMRTMLKDKDRIFKICIMTIVLQNGCSKKR